MEWHCPKTNDNHIIDNVVEFEDTDGTIVGIALAHTEKDSPTPYVSWEYSYFPKEERFRGFYYGHYSKTRLDATKEFCERCLDKSQSMIDRRRTRKEVDNELNTRDEEERDFDFDIDIF